MPAHRVALAHAPAARGEDGRGHALARFVGEPHVIELHLREPQLYRLARQVRRVDPDRVVVGVDPRDVDPVAPQPARRAVPDRPGALALGQERVLGDDEARDRVDAVRPERVEPRPHVLGARALARADLLGRGHRRRVQQAPRVVLHVDHEGVDLGGVGERDQLPQFGRAERPGVHVQALDGAAGGEQHRFLLHVADLDGAERHLRLVGRGGGVAPLCKKAATRDERGQQEGTYLPGHHHKRGYTIGRAGRADKSNRHITGASIASC